MSAKADFTLSFDPEAWQYSVVTYTPRSRLTASIRSGPAVNPTALPTRAVRGSSRHRDGRARRQELDR
jgi:hypothetical protein